MNSAASEREAIAFVEKDTERSAVTPRPTTLGAGASTTRTPGGTMPTLQQPRTPASKIKEQSIKIPDFFKK